MDDLAKHYRRRRKALFQARNRLRSILRTVVAKIEDKKRVRAEFGDVRVKELASMRRKAAKNGWQAREAHPRAVIRQEHEAEILPTL